MTRGWKITMVVAAVVVIAATPLFWLLDSPDTGQLVGASVQAAAGIAALVWALFQRPQTGQRQARGPVDRAVKTGTAEATDGGSASTGVSRPGGAGSGASTAERTGNATAEGTGSKASTGVDYTP
ncbi:hypothetical protein ACFXHD_05990 [Streptomyces hydrogenans]|uniref:hypothetical protein n=1 Tax=Streptomyces hydrogenans TaxID=1873719 RepID=UPI0036C69830